MKLIQLGMFTTVLALSTIGATAQEVQYGVQAGVNLPLSDLDKQVDGHPGFTLGGHLGLYYGNGHELRPWLDFTYYSGSNLVLSGAKNTVSGFGAGADYLYYFQTRPQGIYATGGLGLRNWTVNPDVGASTTKTSLSLAVGAGYRFNRSVSGEVRYVIGQFQSPNGQASSLQALASLRF
ncbi:MAG: outer membrane beta-barrel protein [Holophaga sp.]|nr:outer membrane beta-barrel protein [Holophaga sp.]